MRIEQEKERILVKAALHHEFITQDDVEEAEECQSEIEDHGVKVSLSTIFYKKGILTEDTLRTLDRYITKKFKFFSSFLPLHVQHPFLSSSSIGNVAVENNLISNETLEELKNQKETIEDLGVKVPIGELMVYNEHANLENLRKIQEQTDSDKDLSLDPQSSDEEQEDEDQDEFKSPLARKLGELIVKKGLITSDQLQECLDIQQQLKDQGMNFKVGTIILEKGYCSREAIKQMLEVQKTLKDDKLHSVFGEKAPEEVEHADETTLGQIALNDNILDEEELEDCLDVQEEMRMHGIRLSLGRILIKKDLVSPDQVRDLLRKRREQSQNQV